MYLKISCKFTLKSASYVFLWAKALRLTRCNSWHASGMFFLFEIGALDLNLQNSFHCLNGALVQTLRLRYFLQILSKKINAKAQMYSVNYQSIRAQRKLPPSLTVRELKGFCNSEQVCCLSLFYCLWIAFRLFRCWMYAISYCKLIKYLLHPMMSLFYIEKS